MSKNGDLGDLSEINEVNKKTVSGVIALSGRTFIISLTSLVATAFLTVLLDPGDFGIFWLVSAFMGFLTYFSDIGLAAALIQKKEEPSRDDYKTTFFIQMSLVVLLLGILYILSPLIIRYYTISDEGKYLLFSLAISFFLSSLKTIPSVMLERNLEFGKLVIPQILETFVFNGFVLYFAYIGYGIKSFTYAVFLRGIVGLVSMYAIKPWMPKIGFSLVSVRNLFKFGVPYQLNTLLAVLKDDGMTAIMGKILGTYGIGILGWAQKWGQAPLRFFMDPVIKVTFPAFSRFQDNKEELEKSVARSIFFISFLVFPSIVGILILAPELVEIIPKYSKWRPALLPLFFILFNTFFASFTTQITNLLNAVGKIKTTFKLMVMWTLLTWALVPILAVKYSFNGAAMAYALIGISSLIALYIAQKRMNISILPSISSPFYSSVAMFAVMYFIRLVLPTNMLSFWLIFTSGMVSYLLASYFFLGAKLIGYIKKSLNLIFRR